ncbi:MAG: peptidylprolyl isomerase, partial [Fidelibacterota bacterium]
FNEPLIKRAFQFLQPDNSKSIRLGAAHFFSRTKYLPIDKYEMDLIKLISKETDPEIRMAIVLALSKIESGSTVSLLSSLIEHDIDERVRINAIRALGKIGGLKAEEPIRRSIFDENINVSIAASEYFETAENIFFPEEILNILDRVINWRVRIVLCKSLLIHNYKLKEISTKLISQFENSENIYEKAWILDALSSSLNYIQFIKKETFNSTFPIIRTYGMNGLCDLILKEDLDSSSKSLLVDILIEGIKSGDPVVASLAAGTLSDPKLEMKDQIHDLQFLYNALENLTLPQDYEAAAEIIHAIEYFEGSESLENIIDLPTVPIDWEIYQELPQKPHAIITTNRGTISVQLFNKEAPGTVTNFSKLSTSGFYNGKTFHRVVPNFVVQGGCPRGDGWGSSDPTIRSEFSRLNYKTGFVGMASSGKDTESCQWFITHSPTPHLDGRYTIFGKVISGMDVVNQIQVGDKIESIKIK